MQERQLLAIELDESRKAHKKTLARTDKREREMVELAHKERSEVMTQVHGHFQQVLEDVKRDAWGAHDVKQNVVATLTGESKK